MNKRQKRMKAAVEGMQHYYKTYPDQYGYLDYSDETFIKDAIYAIGICLDKKYSMANGFNEFKKLLKEKYL